MNNDFIIYEDLENKLLLIFPILIVELLYEMGYDIYKAFKSNDILSISTQFYIDKTNKIINKLNDNILYNNNDILTLNNELTGILFKPFTMSNIQKSINKIREKLNISSKQWKCYCV